MSSAQDIAVLLGSETDWILGIDMFVAREPVRPPSTLTIFDVPGLGPVLEYTRSAERYTYSSFSIRIRHAEYDTAMFQAGELIGLLHNRGNEIINGVHYTLIESLDDPALLDFDSNNLARVVANFSAQKIIKDVLTT